MKKTDLLIGFVIGIIAAFLGTYFYLIVFTPFRTFNDLPEIRAQHILGKVITLGAILNIAAFFILLKFKKELMARGVILATIVLAIITMFI